MDGQSNGSDLHGLHKPDHTKENEPVVEFSDMIDVDPDNPLWVGLLDEEEAVQEIEKIKADWGPDGIGFGRIDLLAENSPGIESKLFPEEVSLAIDDDMHDDSMPVGRTRSRSLSLSDEELEELDMRFVDGSTARGMYTESELVPQGNEIKVTPANKAQYLKLLIKHRLVESVRKQLHAFCDGFRLQVPHFLCQQMRKILTHDDLYHLINGETSINVADWESNTTYWGGLTSSSPEVHWFWQIVGHMQQSELRGLLVFVHGSPQVPVGGFQHLRGFNGGTKKFNIRSQLESDGTFLPTAQTCFNTLILPQYTSQEQMKDKLNQALHLHEGFDEAVFED